MLDNLISVLSSTLRMATPLVLAAMGGIFSERSGVINIALEGIMLTGAFMAMAGSYLTGSPWLGLLAAVAAGILISAIHAVVSIEFRADQVVSGTAINILATGLTGFLLKIMFENAGQSPSVNKFENWKIPVIGDIPIIGEIFANHIPFVYLAVILVGVSYWVLWKTPFGLRIRAVGEHPAAADSVGINVKKIRYISVLISGLLAGIGGASLSIGWMDIFVSNMTSGRGFIALAAVIFGRWTPQGALLAALLFGFADSLQMLAQTIGLGFIPKQFLLMLPYILTILALTGVVGSAKPPSANGKPYEKEG